MCFVSGGSSIASVVAGSKPTRSWDKPQFDDIAARNVTAIVGQTAELNCYVKHPGDRVVSDIFMLHLPHTSILVLALHVGRGIQEREQRTLSSAAMHSPDFFSPIPLFVIYLAQQNIVVILRNK